MTKRSLILKTIAVANAVLVTAAFVGCPARKDSAIVPAPIAPCPPLFMNIAPGGGNPQHLLPSDRSPPPSSQDSKNDKRDP
jgi:hypothetical protein